MMLFQSGETCVTVGGQSSKVIDLRRTGRAQAMAEGHNLRNDKLGIKYAAAGFGGRVGWGERPALLVIDLAYAWTDPTDQMGSDLSTVTASVCRLLEVFRSKDLPRYFTTMAYDPSLRDLHKVARAKTPHLKQMVRGSRAVQLVPELRRRADEPLIEKPGPSAFWGTNLSALLSAERVDTVVIAGCSTSGCIRGTAESAFNRGLHAIVPAEAIGDRSQTAHEASLFDINNRYGDVMPLDAVLNDLESQLH